MSRVFILTVVFIFVDSFIILCVQIKIFVIFHSSKDDDGRSSSSFRARSISVVKNDRDSQADWKKKKKRKNQRNRMTNTRRDQWNASIIYFARRVIKGLERSRSVGENFSNIIWPRIINT